MHLALASLDPAWEDKPLSFARCGVLAARAAARGAQLLAFPEMTLTGFTMQATSVAEPARTSPTIRDFSTLARKCGIALAFGVVLEGERRPRNSLVVVDAAGRELARYHKLHPFSFAGEHEQYEAGECTGIAAVADVAFGLSICYDLRFPEPFTALATQVSAFLVCANWPAARIAHWQTLLRARAIETQCYVAGVNRTGTDGNGLAHPRSSLVFDPMGERVQPEWTEEELEGFSLSGDVVRAWRAAFPLLPDRRSALYAELNRPASP